MDKWRTRTIEFPKRSKGFLEKIAAYVSFFKTKAAKYGQGDKHVLISMTVDELEELIQILQENTHDIVVLMKAKDDEPVCVLRAQDNTADMLVDAWAWMFLQRQIGQEVNSFGGASKNMIKHREMKMIAQAMRLYPNRKDPD